MRGSLVSINLAAADRDKDILLLELRVPYERSQNFLSEMQLGSASG